VARLDAGISRPDHGSQRPPSDYIPLRRRFRWLSLSSIASVRGYPRWSAPCRGAQPPRGRLELPLPNAGIDSVRALLTRRQQSTCRAGVIDRGYGAGAHDDIDVAKSARAHGCATKTAVACIGNRHSVARVITPNLGLPLGGSVSRRPPCMPEPAPLACRSFAPWHLVRFARAEKHNRPT
jgi:hypothetical protein